MKLLLTATALALVLATPAAAQGPGLFDEFLNLCDATNINADAAIAKARAAGYVRPPDQFIKSAAIPNLTDVRAEWKVTEGRVVILITGTAPFGALPNISADLCGVASLPVEAAELDKLGAWAAVPQTAGAPIYVYQQNGGRHLPLTSLSDLQSAFVSGDLRAAMTQTQDGVSMIALLRPKG